MVVLVVVSCPAYAFAPGHGPSPMDLRSGSIAYGDMGTRRSSRPYLVAFDGSSVREARNGPIDLGRRAIAYGHNHIGIDAGTRMSSRPSSAVFGGTSVGEEEMKTKVERNTHFGKLLGGYLFPEIGRRRNAYLAANPNAREIISLGIGDTTQPIPEHILEGLVAGASELGTKKVNGAISLLIMLHLNQVVVYLSSYLVAFLVSISIPSSLAKSQV